MKNRKIPVLLILGAALILISFSLMIALQIRVQIGAGESKEIIAKMEALLPERYAGTPGTYPTSHMPVLALDDVDYVAILQVPAFDTTLPVSNKWNSDQLFDAPSRFCGSAYDNTLVIGGADYSHQFAFCSKIDLGAVVTVTDVTGAEFAYTVARVDRAKSAQSQWLSNGDYDLTLFCRDMYSMEYIAVRCNFA